MKSVLIATIIILLACVICVLPLKEVAYAITIEYEDMESFNATPLSFESTNYTGLDTIQVYRQATLCSCSRKLVEVEVQIVGVNITNTDDIAGNFTISFSGFDPVSEEYPLEVTLNLVASESATSECPTESLGNWNYEITPSTRESQRTIIRQREEMRYKKVSLLSYLLNRTQ